jgi:hypothetical protein
MSKLAISEQGHGFEIQKDARDLLGFRPTQSNIHDLYDIDPLRTHIKAVTVKNQKFPRGTISLAAAKPYLECNEPHSILVFYHEKLDSEDIRINRIAWFLIKENRIREIRGDLKLEHAIRFEEHNLTISGDKYYKRDVAQRWKKTNLAGINTNLTLNPKIGTNQNRVQISITTKRLVNILSPTEYATVSLEQYSANPQIKTQLPQKFIQLLPMLGRRYSHEQRFQ